MFTSNMLKETVRDKIGDDLLVVVSNREPYIHRLHEGRVIVNKPASGLVTAMDPMLRATQGVWVAHGGGPADRRAVDEKNRVQVPPGNPQYILKRVWLSKDEEKGYYYGFSNGALWPLCHIVYARPQFNLSDWDIYQEVNRKFANAVLEEVEGRSAFVWIQDYHLALASQMIKDKRPDLRIAQFWHIPWPNPEVFRICPWRKEILQGLLGNDVLGFHIRFHCDNFLNTVAQNLEVRVDYERSSIFHHEGVETRVRPFPISVDFNEIHQDAAKDYSDDETVEEVVQTLPEKYEVLAIGLDRFDYTKGIPERLRAVDRMLEKHPEMIEKFMLLQVGALSRIRLPIYRQLNDEINALVEEINWKYATESWTPIVLVRRNTVYPQILQFYKMANICMVTPLHDGMNLVAKEFISSRQQDDGVLVLSQFAGAARELENGAVLVNPYNIEELADALYEAATMTKKEQRKRMKRMRETVKENNIYRWGSDFITELAHT
jgi:trehalose 6-phosphate synthase